MKIFGPILTHSEGHVFGIRCKIFTIAGPVIMYGGYQLDAGIGLLGWTDDGNILRFEYWYLRARQ